ncbi:MAG: alpha-hydroxy-acid oxidizing protein [Firmicutes bacterium]|jgi:isopentenyl diphosphate isomerase/L-lactate dehydrogenase-like FMN-dependent dehydrogenase|nr:alpha-hydroxy-acid oxidizing protein [Bacillota bacterium]MDH7494525.1 alpha-hydroxy-acid oxidizing protein [Bacillota bacterium]
MNQTHQVLDLSDVRRRAKERMGGICRVCRVCDGRVCAGEVPGMGGIGTGAGFIRNADALAEVKLNMRVLHEAGEPDLRTTLFGLDLEMPVLGAAVAGVKVNFRELLSEADLAHAMVFGCLDAGVISMTGDGGHPEVFASGVEAVREAGGRGIPIIKPGPNADIIRKFRAAEEAGAPAVGVDVDAAGLVNMRLLGAPVGPKSPEDVRELVRSTSLPVILKGIMTPDEAEIAAECQAAAIVVSNHGGRALDHTPGVAEVLPEIAQRVKGRVVVLADGAVRTGTDVLKYLALGADAVLVGRPLAIGAFGGGRDGVARVLATIRDELRVAMILTGSRTVRDIGPRVLWR